MQKLPSQSGQALLLVLLSMAVVLMIILSIVARTVTDISVSTKEDESLRAFSAAEAGVENSLVTGSSIGATTIGNASFTTSVTGATTTTQAFTNPTLLSSGDSIVFWFVGHDSNGNLNCSGTTCFTGNHLRLCWGSPGTSASSSTTPALEASVFYETTPQDVSTVQIGRVAIDPNAGRRSTNGFSADDGSTCVINGTNFQFQTTIDLTGTGLKVPPGSYNNQGGLQFVVVRMLYNTNISHQVGISTVGFGGGGNYLLPPQGLTIDSTGVAGSSNRKVEVFQAYGDIPGIFDAAVFSPSGLVK